MGVDGSPSSQQALRWAARQAELTGATLEAIAVWEWPTTYGWAVPLPADFDPAADATTVVDQELQVVRQAHPAVPITVRVEEGHPAPVLVAASEGAELLVVGSRGHGAFSGMLIGSVSEHCVTHAHCPVLVLRGP